MSQPTTAEAIRVIGRKIHDKGKKVIGADYDAGQILLFLGAAVVEAAAEIEARFDRDAV